MPELFVLADSAPEFIAGVVGLAPIDIAVYVVVCALGPIHGAVKAADHRLLRVLAAPEQQISEAFERLGRHGLVSLNSAGSIVEIWSL